MNKLTHISQLYSFIKFTILASLLTITRIALAESPTKSSLVPYSSGFTIMGITGDTTAGYGDMMLPIFGQATSLFYINPQGLVQNDNSYSVNFGAGFRHLTESAGILGAYVFGDYNHSTNGKTFWFVSPGIERLGKVVDFSTNLYIPISDKRKEISSVTGLQTGSYDHIAFQQHSQYDAVFKTFESVGVGADAEIGFYIPIKSNPKFSVGSYYFNPQDAEEIKGIAAHLSIPLNDQLTFLIGDGYDNIDKNTFSIGLSYNFGGRKKSKSSSNSLNQRMIDPVRRNFIAMTGTSKTAQPIAQTTYKYNGVILKDNIAFFNSTENVNGDGTYEHPFNEMSQENVNTALHAGNNNFYINNGTYKIENQTIKIMNTNIYGRQSYDGNPFVLPATKSNLPLFNFSLAPNQPGFSLTGNQNSFNSIKLQNEIPRNGFALLIENNDNTTISINQIDVHNFNYGLKIQNDKNMNLKIVNSNFYENIMGVHINNHGLLRMNILDSNLSNNSTGLLMTNSGNAEQVNLGIVNSHFDHNNLGISFTNSKHTNISIIDSSLDFNYAGLYFLGISGDANITARNSSFSQSIDTGMWVHVNGPANLNITESRFNENGRVGGVFMNNAAHTTVTMKALNSVFKNNAMFGIFGQNTQPGTNMNITLNHPEFWGNGMDTNKDLSSGINIHWTVTP